MKSHKNPETKSTNSNDQQLNRQNLRSRERKRTYRGRLVGGFIGNRVEEDSGKAGDEVSGFATKGSLLSHFVLADQIKSKVTFRKGIE